MVMKMDFFPNPRTAMNSLNELRDAIICSNSEGLDFSLCERRHFYKHIRQLESKSQSESSRRGTFGHEALAEFYDAMRHGKSKDKCYQAAMNVLDLGIAQCSLEGDLQFTKVLRHLKSLITQYVNRHWDDPIIVHQIESIHILPTPVSGYQYGMKLDLLVEWTKPPYKGELEIWDHKFCYDFRSPSVARLNPQLPKYIAAVRSEGVPVVRGILNQIRYRNLKDAKPEQIFQRLPYTPTDEDLEQVVSEQFELTKRIAERRALDAVTQERLSLRVRSQAICKYCEAQKLCIAELEDGPGSKLAKDTEYYQYQANTYGYSSTDFPKDDSDDFI